MAQFCRLHGWLAFRGPGMHHTYEDRVISFLLSEKVGQGLAPGTVASRVFAIRTVLISMGYGDVLAWGLRIRTAVKALRRMQGPHKNRLSVTPGMMQWLADRLRLGQDGAQKDPGKRLGCVSRSAWRTSSSCGSQKLKTCSSMTFSLGSARSGPRTGDGPTQRRC